MKKTLMLFGETSAQSNSTPPTELEAKINRWLAEKLGPRSKVSKAQRALLATAVRLSTSTVEMESPETLWRTDVRFPKFIEMLLEEFSKTTPLVPARLINWIRKYDMKRIGWLDYAQSHPVEVIPDIADVTVKEISFDGV